MEEREEMGRRHRWPELLWADLLCFFSFVTSHPLQFAYLLFFSPCLLQILSFLSPLLLSTSLLLLACLTVPPHPPTSQATAFGNAGRTLLDLLKARLDGEAGFDPLGSIVSELQASMEAVLETRSNKGACEEEEEEVVVVFGWELEAIGKLYKALACYEFGDYPIKLALANPEKNGLLVPDLGIGVKPRKDEDNLSKPPPQTVKNWGAPELDPDGSDFVSPCLVPVSPIRPGEFKNCLEKGFGPARKEKEWKRTLACKLYEEQKMAENGGEGMDLLWEEYEADAAPEENKADIKGTKKKKNEKGIKAKAKKYEPEEEAEEDEEEEMTGRFCCLQALRFSSGKMNLGMGKPNLMKISKSFKGMGLFRRGSRHSKKR